VVPDDSFFAALERSVRHSIFRKPLAFILNYPSNPDKPGLPRLDFYKDVVAFRKKHDILILSDLAYAEIYFRRYAAAIR